MTIHVSIGEAKARLSELMAAALRGEEVVLSEAGERVRLVAVPKYADEELQRIYERRKSTFGVYAKEFEGYDTTVPPSMTDEEVEERWRRKFGPAD
jgi:prevent-host-death family protein